MNPAIEPLGERMLLLRFGERIDPHLNAEVHAAAATLREAALPGVDELIPAYATLGLRYRPEAWLDAERPPWQALAAAVRAQLAGIAAADSTPARTVEIPVCYAPPYAPDLDHVATHAGLDADAVIARHSGTTYRVAMLGFAPGFPYLLGLDAALHTPRRADPRLRVPAGAVAIGGAQTGIYPRELPGGWQIIGRTPLRLFDPACSPAALLAPGDQVRFRPIDAAAFEAATR
ncbi:MAG TPA: 5-oxoprolinase subunit PxpB [Dokdonella sp.]|uniref:5-oxoprolinase subunit PxpB n=1 Tax=Dokdonella sp. TaxID=2291710 RepID=UPI002C5E6030|nr:5-oxoprolinase subunit PxpB [Dokdonella sp.]HUD43606.1 5-oxoprolinase subunit PxpB [Dokdonella sp.]